MILIWGNVVCDAALGECVVRYCSRGVVVYDATSRTYIMMLLWCCKHVSMLSCFVTRCDNITFAFRILNTMWRVCLVNIQYLLISVNITNMFCLKCFKCNNVFNNWTLTHSFSSSIKLKFSFVSKVSKCINDLWIVYLNCKLSIFNQWALFRAL